MNNFKTTIGIEVHAVILSKSKMFSRTKSCHTDPVNQNVNEVDIALPGTLPSVNEEVVKQSIRLCKACHMDISHSITFDRKHYFYRDLPKGYQITQFFKPIGANGYIDIRLPDGSAKKVRIREMHMEEDTAKQTIVGDRVLLDYNRCGMPLIEIVTEPDINSAEEAMAYLTALKRILNFEEISDAKLEEGSMRADINISIAPHGSDKLGQRVEIKNINSISNVAKAIAYEEERQAGIILTGGQVGMETRRFDDAKSQTIFMRGKEDAIDYHYIPEPNLLPYKIDIEYIYKAVNEKRTFNPYKVEYDLIAYGLDRKIVDQLLDDYPLFKVFNKVRHETHDVNQALTWVVVELAGLLKKDNKTMESISEAKINNLIEMINLLKEGKINSKQGKTILAEIYKTDATAKEIIEKLGFKQITDKNELSKIISGIIAKNENVTKQYSERPERVEKMILGLVMKETHGQANPVISTEVLRELLKK